MSVSKLKLLREPARNDAVPSAMAANRVNEPLRKDAVPSVTLKVCTKLTPTREPFERDATPSVKVSASASNSCDRTP